MQTNPSEDRTDLPEPSETNTNSSNTAEESLVFGRSEYAKKDFWDDRFKASKGFFDWYLEYRELKSYFSKVYPISKESSILMIMVIELSEEMYADGYKSITNIDISSVVIENMKKHYESNNIDIECLEMDATNMTFKANSFDVIVDKGTLDALLCGDDDTTAKALVKEMARVLNVNGQMFIISHGKPVSRKELFRQAIEIKNFDFMYSEQRLSDIAQLINIFRSKLKDKPMSHIFKNPALLQESMEEFNATRQKPLVQRLLEMKKAMDKKKAEEKEAAEKVALKSEADEEGKVQADKVETVNNDQKAKEAISDKEVFNKVVEEDAKQTDLVEEKKVKSDSKLLDTKVEEKEKSEHEEERETKSQKELDYKPQRQAHCFIYYIKKLVDTSDSTVINHT